MKRKRRKTQAEPAPSTDVLIAEIPKGAGRWNQANFDMVFVNYFGAKPGKTYSVRLFHVGKSGVLPANPEVRPPSR